MYPTRFLSTALMACGLTVASANGVAGQTSPFADVSSLCTARYDNLGQAVDAFRAKGWIEQTSEKANEDVLDLMMFALFFGTEPDWSVSQDAFVARFKTHKTRALENIGFGMAHRAILARPDRTDVSSLVLGFEKRTTKIHTTMCTLAGSEQAEAAWIAGLAEDGKLPDAFVNFDATSANSVGAVPFYGALSDTSKRSQTGQLIKFSRERVGPMLPRPMSYDLFFSILTADFDKD